MNLPQIPTDNLYKFMALFGLVIVILTFIFPLKQIRDTHLEVIDLLGQAEIVTEKIKLLEARTNSLMNQKIPSRKELEEGIKNREELTLENAGVSAKVKRIEFLKNELLSLKKTVAFLSGFGAFLSTLGFILWYWKVQRYQDKLLKGNAHRAQQANPPDAK